MTLLHASNSHEFIQIQTSKPFGFFHKQGFYYFVVSMRSSETSRRTLNIFRWSKTGMIFWTSTGMIIMIESDED